MDARKFFYDFGKAFYHIDAIYDSFARSGNAAPTLLWVLYALGDGNPHTQREICADWDLPKSTVNTAVGKLKGLGYVRLVPIKGKRREMTVTLTESGAEYADRLLQPLYQKEAAVFQQLDASDRQSVATLEKLVRLFREDDGTSGSTEWFAPAEENDYKTESKH